MTQTRDNGIVVPINSDAYNLTGDLANMADKANVVTVCATQAARDALALYPGRVVTRADQNYGLEVYNGSSWTAPVSYLPTSSTDTNWSYLGGFYRDHNASGPDLITCSMTLTRIGASFALGTTFQAFMTNFIPAGWRPVTGRPISWGMLCDNTFAERAQLWIKPFTDGTLYVRLDSGSVTLGTNWNFTISASWPVA